MATPIPYRAPYAKATLIGNKKKETIIFKYQNEWTLNDLLNNHFDMMGIFWKNTRVIIGGQEFFQNTDGKKKLTDLRIYHPDWHIYLVTV